MVWLPVADSEAGFGFVLRPLGFILGYNMPATQGEICESTLKFQAGAAVFFRSRIAWSSPDSVIGRILRPISWRIMPTDCV